MSPANSGETAPGGRRATRSLLRRVLALLALAAVLVGAAGCGGAGENAPNGDAPNGDAPNGDAPNGDAPNGDAPNGDTPGREAADRPPPPEPADAPPLGERPAGKVVEVGAAPEGIVADPETGLVAVALRNPNELALVRGDSGETVRRVDLPESARHLNLAGPGGPVLVPVEGSDSFVRVGLPDGEVLGETPVGDFPHNVAATPDGRTFVVNEKASTASIVEDGREVETVQTDLKPGGVAVTGGGLIGVIAVQGLTLEIFEADTLNSAGRIDAGEGPTHVKAGPGDRFYVTDTRGNAVLVYAARPKPEQLDRVPLPGSPYGIALDPRRNELWVTLTARQQVVRFALEGDGIREISRYPTVRQANTVAVDPASGRVFVTGKAAGELQILDPG